MGWLKKLFKGSVRFTCRCGTTGKAQRGMLVRCPYCHSTQATKTLKTDKQVIVNQLEC